jgi:hypothetical protein
LNFLSGDEILVDFRIRNWPPALRRWILRTTAVTANCETRRAVNPVDLCEDLRRIQD